VTATQSGRHQVTLKWNASTTPGVRYNVYRSETAGQYTNPAIHPGLLSQTMYVDVNVASGHTYFHSVRSERLQSSAGWHEPDERCVGSHHRSGIHSTLRAFMGWMLAARLAGIMAAKKEQTASAPAEMPRAAGSQEETP
jgi:hypothetical protein